jgi:hypothetical protein
VETREDLDAVLYGLRGTCELHGTMFQGVVNRVRLTSDWRPAPAARAAKPAAAKVKAPAKAGRA